MIEKRVLDYLTAAFHDVPVAMEVPTPVPERYIVIEKTGSHEDNGLYTATLAIQSIAPTLYEAAQINHELKEAMRGLPELVNIFRCECDSDYNFTNPQTKERRYQAVFDIYYKE